MIEMISARYSSLYEMYREYYKYTDCGPSMGALVDGQWVYCDRLRDLGTNDSFALSGKKLEGICFSSIVEGVEQTTETYEILNDFVTADGFWMEVDRAIECVERDAKDIWENTHGCESCVAHWNEGDPGRYEVGDCPVWPECAYCNGSGAAF